MAATLKWKRRELALGVSTAYFSRTCSLANERPSGAPVRAQPLEDTNATKARTRASEIANQRLTDGSGKQDTCPSEAA